MSGAIGPMTGDGLHRRRAAALSRLRWRLLGNTIAKKFSSARLSMFIMIGFSVVFWIALFALFMDAFSFLNHHRLISGPLIELLFGLFFASLLVMLVFSTGIILYAGLFASEEANFLLVQPLATDLVFAFKFFEAMFFGCWGFLLLGSPMLIAYGINAGAPAVFYALGLPFFFAFAFIPGAVGSIVCLLVAYFLPRRRHEALVAIGLVVVGLGGMFFLRLWNNAQGSMISNTILAGLLEQLQISSLPMLPSYWISRGLLSATYEGGLADSLFYLLALLSNALFGYLLATALFRALYRRSYDRVHSHRFGRRRRRSDRLVQWIDRLYFPLSGPVRVLILKDIRTFVRDPVQWSQVLIFTGLLGFYFVNLGRIDYYTDSPYWRNLIGFINLAVTGLILSAFTTRFVFPLLSLEGHKFWILGLSPLRRDTILWGKFVFAASGAVVVTLTLTLLGAIILRLELFLILLQLVTAMVLSIGLSGIAVGLGARFPEMRETNPSKIAAGFGGTLNLVVSLIYIFVVVAMMALPCHLYSLSVAVEQGASVLEVETPTVFSLSLTQFRWALLVSGLVSLAVGTVATVAPMRMGIRAFNAMEL